MRVVTERNTFVILDLLPVVFHIFLYDILQVGLFGDFLLIGGQQIIQQRTHSMNDILIFLEDCIRDGLDRYVEFGVGIGGDIDESE